MGLRVKKTNYFVKLIMKLFDITPEGFFADTNKIFKLMQIYVRGDAIVLLPFIFLALAIGIFSVRWMVLIFCLFLAFRALGEMMYWLLQQFGDKKYRPYDYGFKKLDNNAIYIIYQLTSLVTLVISTGLVILILQSWEKFPNFGGLVKIF